jgi:EmrB/QacA subfamily drug resistance transporter
MSDQREAVSSSEPYAKRWKALIVLSLSLLVISLDNTILNTALPSLRDDLGASGGDLQWIVDAYILVFAGLLLTAGALGDRFGRKRALQFGLTVFAVGSVSSALATSVDTLTASRALMGVGGAFIMPSTLSIITVIFPPGERAKAIGAWGAISGLGIVLGPLAGGALLEVFDWSAVFWVNVPVALIALGAGVKLIPESRDPAARRIDVPGAVLSMVGLTAIVWAIIEAPVHGWLDTGVVAAAGLGTAAMAAFLAWQRRTTHPMLDLSVFRNARFSASSAALSLLFAALLGSVFLLTQHLQSVLGYSALEAGVAITPLGVAVIATSIVSTRLADRFGTKVLVSVGMSTVAAGLLVLAAVTADSGYPPIAVSLVLLGLGIGMAMAPATDAIMGSVALEHSSVGSAMNDTTRMMGGALGVAIMGSVLSGKYAAAMADPLAALPPEAAGVAESSVGGAAAVAAQLPAPAAEALQSAAAAAFVSGMGTAALVGAALVGAGAVIAAIWLPAREGAEASDPEPSLEISSSAATA